MPRVNMTPSHEILEAALEGLEAQREKLDEQIAQVRAMLGGRIGRKSTAASGATSTKAGAGKAVRKKRVLSPEARKKIAIAQKKRWAQFRKSES